jgi:NADPH-dependent FMN reductase
VPLRPVQQTPFDCDDPAVHALSAHIDAADGFVVITPEYNHGYPAPSNSPSSPPTTHGRPNRSPSSPTEGSPAACGSVEQLRQVFAELHAVTIRDTVSFHMAHTALGAIPVAYGDGLIPRVQALAPDGIGAALDLAGGEAITASLALVTDKDRIGTTIDAEAAEKHRIRRPRHPVRTDPGHTGRPAHKRRASDRDLSDLPLDQAAAAHHDLETGHIHGKIVLTTD